MLFFCPSTMTTHRYLLVSSSGLGAGGQQTMGLRSTATINSFLSFRGLSQSVSRNCSLHFQGKQHARASLSTRGPRRSGPWVELTLFREFPLLVSCYHSYLLPKSKSTQPWSETFWVTLYHGGVVGVAVARRVADDRVIALFSISPSTH